VLPLGDLPEEPPPGIGHNGGPPLEAGRIESWNHYCWSRAWKRLWRPPPREVALLHLRRAEELGVSYRAYAAAMMDTGRPPPGRPKRRR